MSCFNLCRCKEITILIIIFLFLFLYRIILFREIKIWFIFFKRKKNVPLEIKQLNNYIIKTKNCI